MRENFPNEIFIYFLTLLSHWKRKQFAVFNAKKIICIVRKLVLKANKI